MKPGVPHAVRAEQALLGAVLSDPVGQAHVLDLVQAEDMTRPYHAQVLQAMQRLRGRGAALRPLAVREEIKQDPDMPRQLAYDGVVLADLMEASPRSAHAPAYAAIVIGTGIRQRIELAASRMKQAARRGDLGNTLRMAAETRQELGRCQARWDALPDEMRRELPRPARARHGYDDAVSQLRVVRDEIRRLRQSLSTEPQNGLQDRLASIAQHVADAAAAGAVRGEQQRAATAGELRHSGAEAETAGVRTLRELAANPSHIAAVRGWLRPEHFTRPGDGDLYAVMRDMDAAGKPVDPVTVSWEASRQGLQADAADLDGGMGMFAVASAREVHRRGLLALAVQAGQDIQANASDPTASATRVLRFASDRLGRLEPGIGSLDGQPPRRPNPVPSGHARADARREPTAADEHIPEAVP